MSLNVISFFSLFSHSLCANLISSINLQYAQFLAKRSPLSSFLSRHNCARDKSMGRIVERYRLVKDICFTSQYSLTSTKPFIG